MRLMLLEGDSTQADRLVEFLREQNHDVDHAADGEVADTMLRLHRYDLVLLDRQSHHVSGRDVLRRMRERGDTVPVILLTADASIDDKVDCFECGADDCLVKPFDTRELSVRIRALLRRQNGNEIKRINCGDLYYRSDTRQFRHNNTLRALRRREHQYSKRLCSFRAAPSHGIHFASPLSRLYAPHRGNAINIYIHRLRRHLEHSGAQILTLRGRGFLLRERGATTWG